MQRPLLLQSRHGANSQNLAGEDSAIPTPILTRTTMPYPMDIDISDYTDSES